MGATMVFIVWSEIRRYKQEKYPCVLLVKSVGNQAIGDLRYFLYPTGMRVWAG
jgi:hypothetical protein